MPYTHGQVRQLFDRIAHRYDLLNRLLSLGVDQYWRSRLVASCRGIARPRILDVATGTGDVLKAAMSLDPESIVGIDLSRAMLAMVRPKLTGFRYSLIEGEAELLPFKPASFDLVLVAFGVRNFSGRHKGLTELRRVLRAGGQARILEFSRPQGLFGRIYGPYFQRLLPGIGGLISGSKEAYAYLPDTVMDFPGPDAFGRELMDAGFGDIRWRHFTGGIVTLYEASAGD